MPNHDALMMLLAYHRGHLSSDALVKVNEEYWADPSTSLRDQLVQVGGLTLDEVLELRNDIRRVRSLELKAKQGTSSTGSGSRYSSTPFNGSYRQADEKALKLAIGIAGLLLMLCIGAASVLGLGVMVSWLISPESSENVQPVETRPPSIVSDSENIAQVSTGDEVESTRSHYTSLDRPEAATVAYQSEASSSVWSSSRPQRVELNSIVNMLERGDAGAQELLARMISDPALPRSDQKRTLYLDVERRLRSPATFASSMQKLLKAKNFDGSDDFLWDIQFARSLMSSSLDHAAVRTEIHSWPELERKKYLAWLDSRAAGQDTTIRELELRFTSSNKALDGYFLGIAHYLSGNHRRAREVFEFLISDLLQDEFYVQPNPVDYWLARQSLQDIRRRCQNAIRSPHNAIPRLEATALTSTRPSRPTAEQFFSLP